MNQETIRIRPAVPEDATAVVSIFNYFVVNSVAAYSEQPSGPELFASFSKMSRCFRILELEGGVIGFGIIQHFREFDTFRHTGVLTYFILPEYTGQGLGSLLLTHLFAEAQNMGITTLIAHISSLNVQSLNFHRKHGFTECGRLAGVGYKFNQYFDVVWMQKFL